MGADGKYRIDPSIDPWIQRDFLALDANSYNAIEINMASNAPDGIGKIYFITRDSPIYGEDKYIQFQVTNDGSWKTYTVNMADNSLWKGTITGLRIDPALSGKPGTDNTDVIGFDWIKVILLQSSPTPTPTITVAPTPTPVPPAYDSFYENSIVTTGEANTPAWLLKNNFRQKIADIPTFWSLYNSNGKRYYYFSAADLEKVPQGPDIKLT